MTEKGTLWILILESLKEEVSLAKPTKNFQEIKVGSG